MAHSGLDGALDSNLDCRRAAFVACGSGQVTTFRPTAITIHDDSDMDGNSGPVSRIWGSGRHGIRRIHGLDLHNFLFFVRQRFVYFFYEIVSNILNFLGIIMMRVL